MIVILHPRSCSVTAEMAADDLASAFAGHIKVQRIDAEAAGAWPSPETSWNDLLLVIFDASGYPDAGNRFIDNFQRERGGDDAMLLPVAVDPTSSKPPPPADRLKALMYDATASGVRGRLANRVGGMLGLRVQGRHTKIFVSYRGIDGKEIAMQINNHLLSLGLNTFLDEAKEFDGEPTILPGEPVQGEIDQALETASLVLLVDTPRAPESPWIRHEIDTADALLVPILPVCFRDKNDSKKGPRFASLLALRRWVLFQTPAIGPSPLTAEQLSEITEEMEAYLCEIFRRKCRVPYLVEKEFISRGFAWKVLDQKLLMFGSSRSGGRVTTRVLSHCSIFDQIYGPAIRRFQEYLNNSGHANHSLFIYDGELLPEPELQHLAKDCPEFVVILHHQELAALIDSHFSLLGVA